jgi:tetratricopeptide (TPR) repeat protein
VRRTFYWKRLVIVVAAALVLGGAVFAVHHFQANSQSAVIKSRAEKAAAAAETDPAQRAEAVRLYKQYLKFRPADEAAFQKYANLLFEEAKADPAQSEGAAAGAEAFLRAFPNHPAERQKLAELYLLTRQVGKLTLALQHIEMLFSAPGGEYRTNVEVREMAALCERGLDNLEEAIAHLEAAVATGKAPVPVYVLAMQLHYANKKDPKRNVAIDDLLRGLRSGRFEHNLEARVAAARFELAMKNLAPARADLDRAFGRVKGFPDLGGDTSPDALLAQAELELAAIGDADQAPAQRTKAEGFLRKGFALDKKNVAVGIKLAEVLAVEGKRDEGVQVLKQTVDALSAVNDYYFQVIDRLLDLGEQELSASLIESKLAPDAGKKTITAYFRGRLAVVKQDWPAALKLFEEAHPNLVRVPEYHKKAMLGLATCYSAMQNPDKQLEYCREALRDDPGYALAVIGEAEALSRMGKHAEALQKFRLIVYEYRLDVYRTELVRLELFAVLTQPGEAGARDWHRFEESLKFPNPPAEVHIYQAEALVVRGRAADADKLLRDWLKDHPKDPKAAAVWVALARVGGGKPDAAASVLEEALKASGDTIEVRLARAGLLVARAKPATPADFEELAAGAEKFSAPDRFRLLFGLGSAAGRLADRGPDSDQTRALRGAAVRLLRAAADTQPKDLACRATLLDQALAAGQMDVVEQVLKEMALVEGETGPVGTLGRIAIRLPEVRKLADPAARAAGVKELRELALRVRELRPGWSRVYIALAQLDELEGLNDAALDRYREAIAKGDRQEFVVRKVVDLYRAKQQDDKAVGLLNTLSTEVRLPDDLERYRAIYDVMQAAELPKNARPTIDRIAPYKSDDYRLLLLRGALLASVRAEDDALAAFQRAVELADKVPEAWASLVAQLMKHGKTADARRAVDEAKKKLSEAPRKPGASPADLSLALGGLYEMIGDTKAALEYFTAADKLAPLELNPTRQLVMFLYRSGQNERAAELLNRAKESPAPEVARWARRYLALTLMTRPDAYAVRGEALALVERNLAAAPNDPEDLKARACVWTCDPATRDEGIEVLRQFGERGDLSPDEYYLLGRLAFDRGKFLEAVPHFKLAARIRPGVTAEHLAAVVRVYLVLAQTEPRGKATTMARAEAALERLKTNNPTSWEAAREEARFLIRKSKDAAALGESDEAKKLRERARGAVTNFPGWNAPTNLAGRTGPLFEELGFAADAKDAYVKFLDDNKDAPAAHAPLAVFYIHRKQPDKAIQLALAREQEKKVPVLLTARILTGAVRAKRPEAATEAAVEKWLDAAQRAAAGNAELEAGLIGARAELLDAQGKYDESIKEYERSIARGKSDLVVNNLCMLLALRAPARADEAVKMMTDLIAIRGPAPSYLDTRAVAYLVSSRPEAAIKDLQLALVQYERAAYRFHLAWAIDLNSEPGKRVYAADELQRAKGLGLTVDHLHPIELKRYAELFAKYKVPLDEK